MEGGGTDMESKIRYLEMIQSVMSRMASNSFLLKGWTVTIVVGLFAFANIDEMDSKYILLAFIPTVFFWGLDGFFIHQEWLFRELYEHAITLNVENIDFAMNTKPFKEAAGSWIEAIYSKTLLLFYPPIIVVIIIALLLSPHINL